MKGMYCIGKIGYIYPFDRMKRFQIGVKCDDDLISKDVTMLQMENLVRRAGVKNIMELLDCQAMVKDHKEFAIVPSGHKISFGGEHVDEGKMVLSFI